MSTTIRGLIGTSVAALLALAFVPATASAQQQQEQERDECMVTVHSEPGPYGQTDRQDQQAEQQRHTDVPTVERGQTAVALEVQLSEGLREITEFAAAEGSGLSLASEEDLARTEMARTGEQEQDQQPQPISMTEGSRTATVWINTEEASPGTYQVSFRGGDARCDTQLRVKDGASGR